MNREWIMKEIASYLTHKERHNLQSVCVLWRDIMPNVSPIFVVSRDDFVYKFIANDVGESHYSFELSEIEDKNYTYGFYFAIEYSDDTPWDCLHVVIGHNIECFEGEIVVPATITTTPNNLKLFTKVKQDVDNAEIGKVIELYFPNIVRHVDCNSCQEWKKKILCTVLVITSDQIILSLLLPLDESKTKLKAGSNFVLLETKCQKDLLEKTANQTVCEGVIWYDYAVPNNLSISLNHSIDMLIDPVMYDSSSYCKILVNPSFYPYIHGESSVLTDVNKLFTPSQLNCDRWNRSYVDTKYQWIATNVKLNGGKSKFKSRINGLDESNFKIYNELEELFGLFSNKLAAVLWFTKNYRIFTGKDEDYDFYDTIGCDEFKLDILVSMISRFLT